MCLPLRPRPHSAAAEPRLDVRCRSWSPGDDSELEVADVEDEDEADVPDEEDAENDDDGCGVPKGKERSGAGGAAGGA